MKKRKKRLRCFISVVLLLMLICGVCVLGINLVMLRTASKKILTPDAATQLDADCILVLGAGVKLDGTPSDMLRDRLDTGISLYGASSAPKLLMSGDHGRVHYDEVNVMRDYAIAAGVPSVDVFMDHAGFSTYESLYRARDVFAVRRVIIVTQKYHLPRALFIAESLGVEAYGVPADLHTYSGQLYRDIREAAARVKDLFFCIAQPKPTYLGDVIPISGSGEATLG